MVTRKSVVTEPALASRVGPRLRHALGWIMVALASPTFAAPLGTEFTYQGQLVESGVPYDGTAHFRFSLWDALVGGNQVGASQIVSGVSVVGGIFTVPLNGAGQFGGGAFVGESRWLQVEVCTDATCTSTTVLSPRQPVTATPFARFAAGPWQLNGATLFYSLGNVGIGTSAPAAKLDVRGDIRLGPSGEYRAVASGEENLRLLRGRVHHTGIILLGTGFTITSPGDGEYRINFNTPFAGVPTVAANADVYDQSGATTVTVFETAADHATVRLYYLNQLAGEDFDFLIVGPR